MISPLASECGPDPPEPVSTGMVRFFLGPAITALAPAAISAGTLSAAGEALHRLPTMVQRPCTCFEPMRLAASTTPGHAFFRAACSPSSAHETAAPISKPEAVFLISLHRLDALDVDDEVRLDELALHADQQIGSAGENGGFSSFLCQKSDGGLGRAGCFVSHKF